MDKKRNNYINNVKNIIKDHIFNIIGYYKKDNNINIGKELANIILEMLKEEKDIYKDFIYAIDTVKGDDLLRKKIEQIKELQNKRIFK